MTPEVKKRIEQIRQGIVPEGYVKDKDGIYPRDWASKKIGQWLKLAERPIVLQDEEAYRLVTVRRGFGGVDSRGSFLGKNVLVKNYFIVKTGDFIISKRQIAHGACGIVPPDLDGAVVSNEYNVFLPQDGTNIQMFNLMMQLPHYKRLFYLMSDGVHIEKLLFKTQDWMKRTLAMPLLKEQKKIAEILSTQDKAIELQGRKIEELKRFKKGCLERMFPRKGQKVPEKRFPGFTDDWEQRKLEDYLTVSVEKNTGNIYGRSDVLSVSGDYGIVNQIEFQGRSFAGASVSNYGVVQTGDVVYTKSPLNSNPYGIIKTNKGKPGIVSTLYAVYHPKENAFSDFIQVYFEQHARMNNYMHPLVNKGAKNDMKVSAENALKGPVCFPSRIEQESISAFFSALDNLITLHQREFYI